MQKYIDNLTLLRGICCIWVLFFHIKTEVDLTENSLVFYIFSKGYLGVDFFFILSGFIISLNYSDKILSIISVKNFLKRRLLRIYPLHIFSLLILIFFSLVYDFLNFDLELVKQKYLSQKSSYNVVSLVYNLFLVHSWGLDSKLSWNIPSWSISTELFSYLMFPVLIYLRNNLFTKIIVCLLTLSYFYIFIIKTNLNYHYDFGIIRNLFEFYIGYLLSKYYYKIYFYNKKKLVLIIGLILASSFYYLYKIDFLFIIIFCFIILIFSFIKKINFYPLNKLGEISYSFYLNQWTIILIFKYINFNFYNFSDIWFVILIILSNIIYSILTYYYVEKKFYN
jgi:peptidoglycan/LPS O-acetylase OafA/YrhL